MERIASVPSAKAVYLAANTSVLLDIDEYGVTYGNSVAEDIKSGLSHLGFSGAVSIFIYGSDIPESVQRAAGISFNDLTPENRNLKVLRDLGRWVRKSRPPANIFLLNYFSPEVRDFVAFLVNEGYNIRFGKPIAGWSWIGLELEESMAKAHGKYKVARERIYKSSITSVWWDMKTCKAPSGCDLDKVANNICSALFNIDYYGPVYIFTYGDKDPKPHSALITPDQFKLPNCMLVNHVSRKMMLRDMMHWVIRNPAPANVLLISSDTNLADALGSEYNVLFAVPSHPRPCYPAGKTVWISSVLLAGGCPIFIDGEMMPTLDAQYKALNKKYKAARTSVWWDIQNCGIPRYLKGLNALEIIHNIESALLHLGCSLPISFNICGKLSSHLRKTDLIQLNDSSVRLIDVDAGEALNEAPKKAPNSFRKKHTAPMMLAMLEWVYEHELATPLNLLLISGDGNFFPIVTMLGEERRANFLLAVRNGSANKHLMAAPKTLWDWGTLAYGGPPVFEGISSDFLEGIEDNEGRPPAKYKAANTSVWWDMENCKVPEHGSIRLVAENIRSVLSDLGYRGLVCISAHGDTSDILQSDQFALSGISLKPAPLDGKVDTQIIMDMFTWISRNRAPANLLLISGNEVFSSALRVIGERFYNVLSCASLPVAAKTVTSLCFDGGSPIGGGGEITRKAKTSA